MTKDSSQNLGFVSMITLGLEQIYHHYYCNRQYYPVTRATIRYHLCKSIGSPYNKAGSSGRFCRAGCVVPAIVSLVTNLGSQFLVVALR